MAAASCTVIWSCGESGVSRLTSFRPALRAYHESGARTRSLGCRPQAVPFRSAAGSTRRVGNHGWPLTVIIGSAKGATLFVVAPRVFTLIAGLDSCSNAALGFNEDAVVNMALLGMQITNKRRARLLAAGRLASAGRLRRRRLRIRPIFDHGGKRNMLGGRKSGT